MPQQTRRPSPMEVSPPTPESLTALTERNIELIAQLEATASAKRSSADRVADAITRFGGSMAFIYRLSENVSCAVMPPWRQAFHSIAP